jgi:hypothetical protein
MKLSKITSAFIILFCIVILIYVVGLIRFHYSGIMDKIRYENITGIRLALAVYANDFESLPPLDQWCDKLIEKADCAPLTFQGVIGREAGVCGYALNENLIGLKLSALEPKVVLVFEAKGPWNLHGGPELMKASKQKTIAVVFVDGFGKFVKPEEIDQLKWKP